MAVFAHNRPCRLNGILLIILRTAGTRSVSLNCSLAPISREFLDLRHGVGVDPSNRATISLFRRKPGAIFVQLTFSTKAQIERMILRASGDSSLSWAMLPAPPSAEIGALGTILKLFSRRVEWR